MNEWNNETMKRVNENHGKRRHGMQWQHEFMNEWMHDMDVNECMKEMVDVSEWMKWMDAMNEWNACMHGMK